MAACIRVTSTDIQTDADICFGISSGTHHLRSTRRGDCRARQWVHPEAGCVGWKVATIEERHQSSSVAARAAPERDVHTEGWSGTVHQREIALLKLK